MRIALCPIGEIGLGEIRRYALPDGSYAALYNVAGTIHATADACTHGAASLAEDGMLDGMIVECSWHYGKFDVVTGEACGAPCTVALKVYPVHVVDAIVHLEIDAAS